MSSKFLNFLPAIATLGSAVIGRNSAREANRASTPTLAPGVQQFLNTLTPFFGQAGSGNLTPRIPDEMQLSAPWNSSQQQAENFFANWGNAQMPWVQNALGATSGLFGGMNPEQNPTLQWGDWQSHAGAMANAGMLNDSRSNPVLDFFGGISGGLQGALGSMLDGSFFGPNGAGSTAGVSSAMWNGGGGTVGPGFSATAYTENPYIDRMLAATNEQILRDFQRTTGQNLGLGALASGQFGSSRHGVAQGIAMGDLARGMASSGMQTRFQDYSQHQDRQAQLEAAYAQAQGQAAAAGGAAAAANARLAEEARQFNVSTMLDAMGLGLGLLPTGYQLGSINQQAGIGNILTALSGGQQMGMNGIGMGLGAIPGLVNTPLATWQGLGDIGGQRQNTEQNALNQNYMRFMHNGGLTLADLTALSGIMGSLPLGNWNAGGGQNYRSPSGGAISALMQAPQLLQTVQGMFGGGGGRSNGTPLINRGYVPTGGIGSMSTNGTWSVPNWGG